ncbi:hypothetical protein CU633_05980 [Bacillus sp. V3-13]|uniref:hypothetical protein n=1 Tax=Bacillus sp. V3-13 TaxID=2053728 RepID=UPI000C77FFCE|nr:hypothetical protein [Bacillus sp. V3-13]PLR78356.1 hypothetical protein CU633_05980 [Bacillus sp. V3-13]
MNAALVEKITRLVLLELQENSDSSVKEFNRWKDKSVSMDVLPEYPPLTKEELEKWNAISSSIRITTSRSIKENTTLAPLTEEEVKIWEALSSSLGTGKNEKRSEQEYPPFMNKESKNGSPKKETKAEMYTDADKDPGNAKVKFFRHH